MLSQRSLGAAFKRALPSDDEFNRVSFLSHFDGTNNGVNNVFDDGSASNHTITAAGSVTQGSFGPFARPDGEWGVDFGAGGFGANIASNSEFAIGSSSDFTVEYFVFWGNNTDSQVILDARPDNTNGAYPLFSVYGASHASANKVNFQLTTDPDVRAVSSSTLTIGAWNHVVCQRTSGTLEIYINGTKDSTTTSTTGSTTASRFLIGGNAFDSQGASVELTRLKDGNMLSNIRFVNGTAVYSGSSITVPTSALTAITNTKFLALQSNRFVDNSTLNNTITTTSNMSVSAFGPFLTSEVYDPAVNGASAYFETSSPSTTSNAASIPATADFTLEFWHFGQLLDDSGLVGQPSGDGRFKVSYEHSGGRYQLFLHGSGAANLSIYAVTARNQWNHVVVTRDGSAFSLYVNGVRVSTGTSSAAITQSANTTVGFVTTMKDYITDVRVTTSLVYTGTTYTIPTAPLTAITNTQLLLNMADGQAIDSAAQSNLTLIADSKLSNTQAKFGDTSMYFDGSGDYALFPNTPFGTGDFTVECWVRCLGTSYDKGVWDNHTSSGSSDGLTLTRITEQQFRLFGTGELIRSGNFTITNTWVNVAVVRSSGTLNLFVNGVSQGTTSFTTNMNSTADFVIGGGRYSGGPETGSLNAFIDEFRISHMARYTSNFTPATEPFADKGE